MTHSGARQWRVECECRPELAEARDTQEWERMHSQVSQANAKFFISEDRLRDDDWTPGQLKQRVQESDGTIVVCNVCGRLKEVGA